MTLAPTVLSSGGALTVEMRKLAVDNSEYRRTKSGDESDAYGRWRKYIRWKPGQIKAIKRRTHKRERQDWKQEGCND
jgi:Ni/Co efflux regulator RcnB